MQSQDETQDKGQSLLNRLRIKVDFASRVDEIAENLRDQHLRTISTFQAYSIAIDESTDIRNIAQLAIFNRGCNVNLKINENLLEVIPMHNTTTRADIFDALMEAVKKYKLPMDKLAVSTGFLPTSAATWSVTDWRRVIFSDESRFSLSADDHRTRVWRRTGQRSDPAFIVERHTAISQGVTVWGAISWDTRSSLVVLQGTLTARRYVDDILTPIVLMLSIRPGAIYQQDNARPHTARLSQQCLQGYDVLPWPARDLSPKNGKATAAVFRYRRICADYGRIFHRGS
ncbi:transposable element Tc1 transposase [Trichonephila clavipes]|nr:transposable element Tc1 transposase [Trichonephila clavipes]